MLATFFPRVEGELLDLRAADGGVQVVMQATAFWPAEETGGQSLQLAGPQRLGAAAQLVAAIEQAVDVLFDETLTAPDGLGVAEQEQNACPRLQMATGDVMQQAVEQLDRRGFIAVDTGRQQQVQAVVPGFGRLDLQRALAQPAHPYAFDSQR